MLISLIVPCYNEEEAMPLFYKEASRVAAEMKASHGAEFEFIFVDDGSRDGTLRVARELHAQDSRVRYVSFSRNFGKEAGIYAGLQAAKGRLCRHDGRRSAGPARAAAADAGHAADRRVRLRRHPPHDPQGRAAAAQLVRPQSFTRSSTRCLIRRSLMVRVISA